MNNTKRLVRNIAEPQTIYITGLWVDQEETAFGLTDDYETVSIEKEILNTSGFVYIFTETEWQRHLLLLRGGGQEIDGVFSESYGCDEDYMVIEDVVGDITVSCKDEDEYIPFNDDLPEDISNEYLFDYVEIEGSYPDMTIEFNSRGKMTRKSYLEYFPSKR